MYHMEDLKLETPFLLARKYENGWATTGIQNQNKY